VITPKQYEIGCLTINH